MKIFIAITFTIVISAIAFAQQGKAVTAAPMLYSRDNIIIKRAIAPSGEALPWQGEDRPVPDLVLDVEVRDAAILYKQNGWYNLSSPSEKRGFLLLFSSPTISPISSSAQYAPLDVLMVDKHGVIREIAPRLMMAELVEDITPNSPVLAFLFLQGGACERLAINPGDTVKYKIFTKPPTVLSLPTEPTKKTPQEQIKPVQILEEPAPQ